MSGSDDADANRRLFYSIHFFRADCTGPAVFLDITEGVEQACRVIRAHRKLFTPKPDLSQYYIREFIARGGTLHYRDAASGDDFLPID
jgi:hypothetical protein